MSGEVLGVCSGQDMWLSLAEGEGGSLASGERSKPFSVPELHSL